MSFTELMGSVTKLFEVLGVGVILAGLLMAAVQAVVLMARGKGHLAYERVRATFGRSILLGLELLVAGDIIRTVAVDPTLNNLMVLGLLVIIRTFLSWSLEVEIDGRWPWQAAAEKKRASQDSSIRP